MNIPLYQLLIEHDALTRTPVTVPEYEVPILQEIHGHTHILSAEGKPVDQAGLGKTIGSFTPPDDEYQRLCRRYGTAPVIRIYGKTATQLKTRINKTTRKTDNGTTSSL